MGAKEEKLSSKMEKDHNSLMEIIEILTACRRSPERGILQNFVSLKVMEIFNKADYNGFQSGTVKFKQ